MIFFPYIDHRLLKYKFHQIFGHTQDPSGQIIIFHQPGFPWNKGLSLHQLPFGGPGPVTSLSPPGLIDPREAFQATKPSTMSSLWCHRKGLGSSRAQAKQKPHPVVEIKGNHFWKKCFPRHLAVASVKVGSTQEARIWPDFRHQVVSWISSHWNLCCINRSFHASTKCTNSSGCSNS